MYRKLTESIESDAAVPEEYVVLKLAEKFHRLPHEIREMPEADYRLMLHLYRAEAEANDLKGEQRKHHGK